MTGQVSFTADRTYGIAPLGVNFVNTSGGYDAPTYVWDFGDGKLSNIENPFHIYRAGGRYPITLSVRDGTLVESTTQYIIVTPAVDIESEFASGKFNGITIQDEFGNPVENAKLFTYASGTNYPQATYQDDGEGTMVPNPNPLLSDYAGTFPYDIGLITGNSYKMVLMEPESDTVISQEDNIINNQITAGKHIYLSGSNFITGTGEVIINCVYPNPTNGHGLTYLWWVDGNDSIITDGSEYADFTVKQKLPINVPDPDVELVNNQLLFHRAGSYSISTSWFLGASVNWPIQQTVFGLDIDGEVRYTPNPKSYNNRYSAFDSDNFGPEFSQTSWSQMTTVSVGAGERVNVKSFAYTSSIIDPASLGYWGSIMVSAISNVPYSGGAVPPVPSIPTAAFSPNAVSGNTPQTIAFQDMSTGWPQVNAWYWDFGDGNISTDQNPSHEFGPTVDTTYTVTLIVANSVGNSAPAYGTVTVLNPIIAPVASFVPTNIEGNVTLDVNFTDTSSNSPISWAWDFGDGNTSTDQNPTHSYTVPQQLPYNVSMTATNTAGNSTAYGQVTAHDGAEWGIIPVPSFTAVPTTSTGTAPLLVTFTDTTYGFPTSWQWDFGDGNISYSQNPTHTYALPGTYLVQLIASNVFGTSPTPALLNYVIGVKTYHIYFLDDIGAQLPIYVDTPEVFPAPPVGLPISSSAITDLISQLNGLTWTLNDNVTPAVFNDPPEPGSTNNVINHGRDYFFQDGSTSVGRWLYLHYTFI